MTEIDDLADTIRAGLSADEQAARNATPGPWAACHRIDGSHRVIGGAHPLPGAATDNRVVHRDDGYPHDSDVVHPAADADHIARQDPNRTLAEVASKRALVDALLAEKHHVCIDQYYTCRAATEERDGGVYGEGDQPGPCDCGRDERVHAYLTLLARPYQEAL